MTLTRPTLYFAIATMGAAMGGAGICAYLEGGWVSASILNAVIVAALLIWTVVRRDAVMARLLLFGFAAGVVEVAVADPVFIDRSVLTYVPGGPKFVESPLYMPFGWVYVVAQLGVVALFLDEKIGTLWSGVGMTGIGAFVIPVYETLAKYADWWFYTDPHMLFGTTPWFVVASEGLIGLGVAVLVRPLAGRSWPWALLLGAILGLAMWGAGVAAHAIIG